MSQWAGCPVLGIRLNLSIPPDRVDGSWPVLGHHLTCNAPASPRRFGDFPTPALLTFIVMILELELPETDHLELVQQIHDFLEPAKRHLEKGGNVTLTKQGKVVGVAATVEELMRLASR